MNPILLAVLIVSGIGFAAGIGLAVANILMSVKKDEKEEAILKELPGANCGACSFSGCSGYAQALAKGNVKTNLCTVGGAAVSEKICEILGVEMSQAVKKYAYTACGGSCNATSARADYQGLSSCKAAVQLYGGVGSCRFGCLGLGDCVRACEYNAVKICDGVAVVDKTKCLACGLCAAACPKKLIFITTDDEKPILICSNTDNGAKTRKVCKSGCIGCRLCSKVCENDAISFDGGKAVIDKNKCIGCGKCKEACKVGCIV